ncbi:MAG: hypothetical protein ACI841_000168 [Planctomycetota bacterium]|jgi:hypothetical protein
MILHRTLTHTALFLSCSSLSGLAIQAPQRADTASDVQAEPTRSIRHDSMAEWELEPWRFVDSRANEFTASTQDAVCLDTTTTGGTVLAWQSRRQESGTYGIYARRFDDEGHAIGPEVHVNSTTRNMQTRPSVSVDGKGGVWISWTSFGQDGDQGTIVARRFDPTLQTASREVVVNEVSTGHQDNSVIQGLGDGSALVIWTSDHDASGRQHLRSRTLAADTTPLGSASRLTKDSGLDEGMPTVDIVSPELLLVAYPTTHAVGKPAGILLQTITPNGVRVGEAKSIESRADGHAIEPSFATADDGRIALTWCEAYETGYRPHLRFARIDPERGVHEFSEVFDVDADGPGYVSGVAVEWIGEEEALVCWSRFADGPAREAALFAQRFQLDGDTDPIMRVSRTCTGSQRLRTASGPKRMRVDALGVVHLAWSGNAELGDTTGAHLTRLEPVGIDARTAGLIDDSEFEFDAAILEAPSTEANDQEPASTSATLSEGEPAPHDLPTYDPRAAEKRITEPSFHGPGADFDFLGITNTGWAPPDPEMAVGPNHVVLMTNGAIAWFQKDGTFLFQDEIEDSTGFWGSQGATSFVFDPEVIFDPHSQRFMAMANERASNGRPYFLLAISDDDDPQGSWHKYRIDVQTAAGDTDIDSPNISVDEDVIYLTADFFQPDKFLIYMIEKAPVLSGGSINATSTVVFGTQSMGMPVTFDTNVPAHYMIEGLFGGSSQLKLYAIQNQLTAPTITTTFLAVPSYTNPEDPPQLGSTNRPETFEPRFWSAVYRDGFLWATHHINSSRVRQRWYQIAMNDWPSGGTPSLVQSGTLNLGSPIRTFFGSIWVDENQNMALTYARSAPDEFISMERTWRAAGDPLGTTRPGVSVQTSTAPISNGRWGDYSSTVDDPVSAGFWSFHQYRLNAGWRTRVAFWGICGGSSIYCTSSPNSVGAGAQISASGSTSVASNDLVLDTTGCPANQPGIYYYGSASANLPFGNGIRCAGGTAVRMPPQTTTGSGQATLAIDLTNLPGGNSILVGDTKYFQFWYRDPAGGGANFNLSDGLKAEFCP